MTGVRILLVLALGLVALARSLHGQDTTTQKGVRIGLTYRPGIRPGVVVLPVAGGDSVRAILQRDLDYSDRVEIVGREGTTVAAVVRQQGTTFNYPLWKRLGALAIVEARLDGRDLFVAVHDVAAARVMTSRQFSLPRSALSGEWRMALHGIADEVERWITGTRGMAQTRIAFARDRRIFIIDSDGWGERPVTDGVGKALSPAWHPDGRVLAYSLLTPRGTQLQVHDTRAGRTRVVPGADRGLNITPEFSPDGEALAFAHAEESGTDIYIADGYGNGRGARRVTVGRGSDNMSPTFSPDGKRLAFTSNRAGPPQVYTVDVDGANAELLTTYLAGDQSYRSDPAWSPDGRMVAFQSQIAGRFQVMTITLRDRRVKQLTSEGRNEGPSWAPDGRHLVFSSTRAGAQQLVVLDVETGRTRQLTRGAGSRLAAWSRVLERAP